MLNVEWGDGSDQPGSGPNRPPTPAAAVSEARGRSRAARPRPPLTPLRVIGGYVITLIAIATGAPFVYLGLVQADRAEGFSGIGWAFGGFLVAGLVGLAVLLVLSLTSKAGPVFFVVDLLVLLLPQLISNWQWLWLAVLLVAPGVAAWVAHPPRRPDRSSRTRRRFVLTRSGAVALFALVLPGLLRLVL